MIWEKFYVEIQGGQVTPVAPSWGAHAPTVTFCENTLATIWHYRPISELGLVLESVRRRHLTDSNTNPNSNSLFHYFCNQK